MDSRGVSRRWTCLFLAACFVLGGVVVVCVLVDAWRWSIPAIVAIGVAVLPLLYHRAIGADHRPSMVRHRVAIIGGTVGVVWLATFLVVLAGYHR